MATTKTVPSPDEKSAAELVKVALGHEFEITDHDMYLASAPIVKLHDDVIEKLTVGKDGFVGFNPLIDWLHKGHKHAIQLRDQFLNPVLASKKKWLNRRLGFEQRESEKKRIENAQAAEALRKQQTKELEKDARKLEKQGDVEAAAVVREQAGKLPMPTLPFAPAVEKQEGFVNRTSWKFEIVNVDEVPREFCDPTPGRIRKVVDALGDKCKIPGIRVWKETSQSSRKA